jgi:hypothetical protein
LNELTQFEENFKEGFNVHVIRRIEGEEVYLHSFLAVALNFALRQIYPQKRENEPIEQVVRWAPESVWRKWKSQNAFVPSGRRNPDLEARR